MTNTVVIGAGAAGLASAAELRRRGVAHVVLEQADEVGASWRGRYDRLRLNSSRPFAKLPRGPYAHGTPMFPSRDEVVRYLEGYAVRHELDVRCSVRVERIDESLGGWVVRTSAGDMVTEQVVVAGGHDRSPVMPSWPGRNAYAGDLTHVADYRNAEPYRGRDVLVVGAGCSGMEIAYDVLEGGAARVRIAVRTAPNMLIRSPLGPGIALTVMKLGAARADRIVNFVRRREIGDLAEVGLPIPDEGVFARLKRLGVAPAIVDKEVVQALRERRIEVVAGVEDLDETGVLLADGARIEPDAVIAATGYRRGLEPLVGHLGVLDDDGNPRVVDGDAAAPGLRFVGYDPVPAQLRHMGHEARRAAKQIAREVKTSELATDRALAMAA